MIVNQRPLKMSAPASIFPFFFSLPTHHRSFLALIIVIVVTTCPLADGIIHTLPRSSLSSVGGAVVATFDSPHHDSEFSHLTINTETQMLYVGADNYLYSLKPDLSPGQTVETGPKDDNPECPPPIDQFQGCAYSKKKTDSYNKALIVDYAHKRLIACFSLFHGYCEKRNLSDITQRDQPSFVPVVANTKNASTVAFIAPGPAAPGLVQHHVLYVSASWTNFGQKIWRERVPAFSSRNLDNFSLAYSDNFRQTHIRIEVQQRESFRVMYEYGFGSNGFSYMITVQKKNAQSENYISKIFRVCQNDKNFYSYVEVELQCKLDNSMYNLVQAAYLGKPGKVLAQSLNIPTTEDVLYTVFSKGHNSSPNPTGQAALCVFPMRMVRRKFTENIQECFSGIGNTGPDHISKPVGCLKNTQTRITDDYCGESEVNQPIGGSDPIVSEAAVVLPANANASAIAVTITEEYTVAFVGTANGYVIKISLESGKEGNIYESVRVQAGKAVKKDLHFDEEAEHLYVLTNNRVSKVRVQDCSRYQTCSECLGARDPYCGWCSLENKCSLKKECQGSEQSKRWLPYFGEECTKITYVRPDQIQKDRMRLLTLHIQNLPDFEKHYTFQCAFAPMSSSSGKTSSSSSSSSVLSTQANRTSMGLQCYTPATHLLPPVPTDSIVMRLSVVMNQQEFVSTNFTFFDCNVHTSCTKCTQSDFECTWCVRNHRCTHQADEFCRNDIWISGQNVSGSSSIPGPDNCPRLELASPDPQILVPADTTRAISVHGLAMQDFQKDNLRCEFNIDSGKSVPASVTTFSDNRVLINCSQLNFNYHQSVSLYSVPFKIYWGDGSHPLDNPNGVQVVMYKCWAMAGSCGECFTVDDKYGCGWCGNSKCSTARFCPANKWLAPTSVCPNITITSIHPYSGPSNGGTRLTVQGENLGQDQKDVMVDVDGVPCSILEFEAPRKVVCLTGPANIPLQMGKVRVVVRKSHKGLSEAEFRYVQPEITGITPAVGPIDGGTLVTILGNDIDAGTSISVTIGDDMPCLYVTSLSRNNLTCVTTNSSAWNNGSHSISVTFDNTWVLGPPHVTFSYLPNPIVKGVDHKESILSGGVQILVIGEHLDRVQSPSMILWYRDTPYEGPCKKSVDGKHMWCRTPGVPIPRNKLKASKSMSLAYGFRLDGVKSVQNLTALSVEDYRMIEVFPDPHFMKFEGGKKVHQEKNELLVIEGSKLEPLRNPDIIITVGQENCTAVNVGTTIITCKPPPSQPPSLAGSGFPEVMVAVGNLTFPVGVLHYEEPEVLSFLAIAIAVGTSVLVILLIIVCILYKVKSRRSDDMMKKMRIQMDMLEARVANECKEAFAELQTDMTELTSDTCGQVTIPFWDYRTYCMRIMFPGSDDHAVVKDLQLDFHRRDSIERGLRQFSGLVSNKTFILTFIRTLEANRNFNLRDRVNVASLISVALQTQMEYSTEILKTLLAELIEKTVESKNTPKLLLRRNESVAEKMLTNWFTFLLYKFLKECAGEPLFMLFQAIKQQTSKGPVDSITGEARYSLSEDKLIRQQIQYKSMTLYVLDVDMDRCTQPAHPVKVLDCDTISQVKEKILDAIYKNAPFSSRPPKDELDLVLFDHPPEWICADKSQVHPKFPNRGNANRLALHDEDGTSKLEGDCRRINTLAHYQVPDGAYVALHHKQLLPPYNMSIMTEKSNMSFYNRSPTLPRSVAPQMIHVVDVDNNGIKHFHLVRQHDVEPSKEGDRGSKMVSEIYLPRLLVTKGTLQVFVDDLFERIFSTAHRGSALPLAIKYMFDFLDDQALLHNIQDPEVVHTWKSNSLPLRFWVNIIKNPDFAFDVHKTNIADSCLTVVGQTFMDACSQSEHRLGKDSPSSKLLYAKDIPRYKQWVERYYQDIKMMPAISDQDMTAMLTDESRIHGSEFNANAALLELYKYAQKYNEELRTALDEDEFARKSKLSYKLDSVHAAMDGNSIC